MHACNAMHLTKRFGMLHVYLLHARTMVLYRTGCFFFQCGFGLGDYIVFFGGEQMPTNPGFGSSQTIFFGEPLDDNGATRVPTLATGDEPSDSPSPVTDGDIEPETPSPVSPPILLSPTDGAMTAEPVPDPTSSPVGNPTLPPATPRPTFSNPNIETERPTVTIDCQTQSEATVPTYTALLPECFDDLDDIRDLEFAVTSVAEKRVYYICPGDIVLGQQDPNNPGGFIGGSGPFYTRMNAEYRCGTASQPSTDCFILNGNWQVIAFDGFWLGAHMNVRFVGITFESAIQGAFLGGMVGDITFEDCSFNVSCLCECMPLTKVYCTIRFPG